MHWLDLVTGFDALVAKVVERVPKAKLERILKHDKQTVNGWISGSTPESPSDVALLLRTALEHGIDLTPFQTFRPMYDFGEFTKYERHIAAGPPPLAWLTGAGSLLPKIHTRLGGLSAKLPLGLASSPLTADADWTRLGLDLGYGISTFKTRRTGLKESWLAPQVAFVQEMPDLHRYDPQHPPTVKVTFAPSSDKRIHELVNSIGVPSEESPMRWLEQYAQIKAHPRGHQVGLSVIGEGDTLAEIQRDLLSAVDLALEQQPPFIELNISCPNLRRGVPDIWKDLKFLQAVCRETKAKLQKSGALLFLKLPVLRVADLKLLVSSLAGLVDGLVYRNTLRVRPVVEERHDHKMIPAFNGREFGGMSGPLTFDITRRGITTLAAEKRRIGCDMFLVAVGGVTSPKQVEQLLDDGASAVQVCTGAMFDPLLAWKTAFHFSTLRATTQAPRVEIDRDIELQINPRDDVEAESWRNLQLAVREIRNRRGTELGHETVIAYWNEWIERRPLATGFGAAQRTYPPRSVSDWVKVLTR